MNRVRQLCATTLLAMLLAASSALAGDLPMGIDSTTPPPARASATGDMPQGVTSEIDPVTELMLNLLQSLLSIF